MKWLYNALEVVFSRQHGFDSLIQSSVLVPDALHDVILLLVSDLQTKREHVRALKQVTVRLLAEPRLRRCH